MSGPAEACFPCGRGPGRTQGRRGRRARAGESSGSVAARRRLLGQWAARLRAAGRPTSRRTTWPDTTIGKTTLLNRLLRDPAMRDCLVLVNELGEIGIDHVAVQEVHEQVVLLESGCLCCALRADLVDTLRSLFIHRLRGEIPPFGRIVIGTTGMADPVPIVHTQTDPRQVDVSRPDTPCRPRSPRPWGGWAAGSDTSHS